MSKEFPACRTSLTPDDEGHPVFSASYTLDSNRP